MVIKNVLKYTFSLQSNIANTTQIDTVYSLKKRINTQYFLLTLLLGNDVGKNAFAGEYLVIIGSLFADITQLVTIVEQLQKEDSEKTTDGKSDKTALCELAISYP